MRRILFWSEYSLPAIGGAEILSFHLLKGLKQRGYVPAILSDDCQGQLSAMDSIDGISIFRLPFREAMQGNLPKMVSVKRRLAQILASLRTEIVHLHTTGPSAFFFLEGRISQRFPSLLTVHSIDFPKLDWNLNLFNSVRLTIGVSHYIGDEIRRIHPAPSAPIRVIHNSLPPPRADFSRSRQAVRTILMIGRIEKEKGFDVGIKAFAELCKILFDIRLHIAGQGRELASCQNLAANLAVAERIHFLGWVAPDKIAGLIAESALVVIPSRWQEPFGMVALQAAQLERPVVATRVGGLKEVIKEGVTGLLVPNEDVEAMTRAMHSILSQPGLAFRMGQQGKQHTERCFGFERMLDQYEEVYRSSLDKKESAA